ncbi:leucine--tRNA ligase [Buchananella hordeovulneris]|uniref:leucine--tRNA ligase n=1 Tax=Buchananella hordeovulneris TaxID=52770 RepID=UPI0026DD7624|nr:class I tRNA ligase family protein [Buchananella hordeovulneris]MDO5080409.1 class I tRNA ligase family protein [Buchananella hordeovulneris]
MTVSEPSVPAFRYTAQLAGQLEQDWQERWEERGTFHVETPTDPGTEQEKFFLLDMFPFPSGKGLHVGHPLGYIATDVVGRYQRMRGKNVLHTLGYDAFGLPAEQYALQTGRHPRETTEENIANMRAQLRRLGLAHDPRRSLATTDREFVKFTQWIFLQIRNSWYDSQAGKARPISELEAEFASGQRPVPGGWQWDELDATQRYNLLEEYRLAYVSSVPVNWCPGLGTVLANEEVTAEGRSERGNFPVFQRRLRQWMMRITAYGDRLVDDLDILDWPDKVKMMQRHWVGRSEGTDVDFNIDGDGVNGSEVTVYTTRPDTLFGASFLVFSPEHPLLGGTVAGRSDDAAALEVPRQWPDGTRPQWTGGFATPVEAVAAYRATTATKTPQERIEGAGDKTGVFTGLWATNPATGKQLPVFIADYVLMDYGTGAVMAVPGHDARDWAFATKFNLDIVRTIGPAADPYGPDLTQGAYTGDGVVVDSANAEVSLNGLDKDAAKAAMTAWLETKGAGRPTVTYRLRDWLFSRQRYWGEPFPIVYDAQGHAHSLPADMLPVDLPALADHAPRTFDPHDADSEPEPPLGRATDWLEVRLDLGDGEQTYRRETNTMPNWAGSCWYEMRYLDPTNPDRFVGAAEEAYWMGPQPARGNVSGGADLYVGGVEHAVLHLLYARFWHKVLFDLGHVTSCEPFHRLFNQGYIQAYAYKDERGQYVPADEVEGDESTGFTWQGQPVNREYGKMGKSLKNIVTPDEMCAEYGADTFRLYEMSMGPLDQSRPWETRAVVGSFRFLQRLWRNIIDEETGAVTVTDEPADLATTRLLHKTIAGVGQDLDGLRMNTAIAKLIVLNNHLTGQKRVARPVAEALVLMLAPFAPHVAEELWSRLGHTQTLAYVPFPQADPAYLVEELVTCVVQVAGKVRAKLEVAPGISDDELTALALAEPGVAKLLDGRAPAKVVVRAPRLVNIVPPKS